MKKFVVCLSFCAMSAFAADKLTGTISDSKCAEKHADASQKSMECAQKCIKGGASPVIISDGKVYQISADSRDKVMNHIGHKVTVTGTLQGDTMKVSKVKMEKAA